MLETGHAPHRPGSRRILLVTPSSPYPANSGGAQRTALLHAALSRHAEVDLFLLGSPTPDVQAVLTESFRLVGTFKNSRIAGRILRRGITLLSPELDSCLPDRSKAAALSALLCENDYDAVVVRYSATACMLSGVGRCPKTLLIVDVDDLVADLTATGALPGHSAWRGFPRRFLNRLTRRWIEPYERRNLLRCDGLWLNGRTPAWLAGGDRRRVVRLPNIPYNRAESHVVGGRRALGRSTLSEWRSSDTGQMRKGLTGFFGECGRGSPPRDLAHEFGWPACGQSPRRSSAGPLSRAWS
jgi:hypothetical protein